jgi:hypothetical protein
MTMIESGGQSFLQVAIVVLFAASLYCVPDVFCLLFLRDRGRARLCKGELLCGADDSVRPCHNG